MRKRHLPRLLTVLLSVGLLVQNMPLAVLADTLLTATEDSAAKDETADADSGGATETQNTNIVFDTDELSDALIQAVDEKAIVKKTYSFTGYVAEDYEQLFDTDYEDLYELRALERKEGDLTVRVFARLDEDGFATDDEAFTEFDDSDETGLSEATMSIVTEEDSDAYMITGNEQIIFLLLNNTVSPQSTHIEIDGRVSPEIKILTAKQIKKQLSDDDDDDETATPKLTADSTDAVDHPSDGDDTTPATGDTANADAPSSDDDDATPTTDDKSDADAPSSDDDGTTPTTGDTANADAPSSDDDGTTPTTDDKSDADAPSSDDDGTTPTTDDKSDADAPASDDEDATPTTDDKSDADAPSTDGDGTTPTTDDKSDADTPSSDGDDTTPATPNEIPKTETADMPEPEHQEETGTADMPEPEHQEENSEATLLGDLYESVLFKKTPATAFVATLSQFMDYEIALLDVGDNIVKVTGRMEWTKVQEQIDAILTDRPGAEIKIQGQGTDATIVMTGLTDDVDSSNGGLGKFKAWNLRSDTIIENVTLELPGEKSTNDQPDVAIFANGHKFTVEPNVHVVYVGGYSKRMYIFGGGNKTNVDSTHLEIKGGDWERVYGGSYQANAGDTYVYVAGPMGLNGQGEDAGDAAVLLTFGGCYRGVTKGNTHVLYGANRRFYSNIKDSSSGPSNVCGSGHDMKWTDPIADVTGAEMKIDILDGAIVSDVYGGYNSNLNCDDIYLHVAAGAHVSDTTHGGTVHGGTTTSNGGMPGLYTGNGYAPKGKQYTAYSNIHLTFDGEGKLENQKLYKTTVMGGGTFGHVEGNIEVIINGNTEYVYGGSSNGNVTGNINVTVNGKVLAGSHNADAVIGDVTDTWLGGTVQGGCMQGNVTGVVTTTIGRNASVHAVIGGCDDGGVHGSTSVHVYGTILKERYQNTNRFLSGAGCVFGAGYLGESWYIDATDVTGTSSVYIYEGSNVQGDVYGGGLTARASGGTHVEVSAPIGGDVYGGSWLENDANIIKAAELSEDGLEYVYKEKELGYVGGEKADTYVELNGDASVRNVYGGGRGTNAKGSSTVVLKDHAKAMNVYGTGNAITNFWSRGKEYTFGPLPITTSGDATIRIEDSAVVQDTIYGYDIVTPKDEEGNDLEDHKLLGGEASVLFDHSNSGISFKRVKNADFVHLTDTSAVAIDNDHKDEEQLVNVGDLNIDADSALTLGASAHIYGNYQGGPDKEKSAKLIIPADKRLTADGTVTQFTKISIYDFNEVVPAEKQVYVVSGAGSKTDTGDFIWVDERNDVTMEWNMHSVSGETKAEKPTMWWLVKKPTQPKPDPKPDSKPSSGGGGGGGSRVVPGSRAVITTPEPGRVLGVNRTPETETEPETKAQTGRVLGARRVARTGDTSLIAVWFTLMLIAMTVFLGFIVFNRRWRRRH